MGFSIFERGHTVLLYGFFPSADIGQVVYYNWRRGEVHARRCWRTLGWL